MSKRAGIIMGAITALAVIIAIVAVVSSGGDDNTVNASSDQTTTTTTLAPSGGGNPSGGGGNPSGGGGGQQSSNEQPYFQPDHSIEAFFEDGKPQVRVDLHAYDPDGPEEEEVLEIQIDWGDGNQTTIPGSQGSNNAFSSTHEYDPSLGGTSVHVVVRAVDADGGSAEFSGDVTLPMS